MMNNLKGIIMTMAVALLIGCDKAPDGVIPESKMVDFLKDLHKVESAIDLRQEEFQTDSSKQVMKQALFKKYGITQDIYDSSMVWYAHNPDTYQKVYKKVILELQDELKESSNRRSKQIQSNDGYAKPTRKLYPATGDSADIWNHDRILMLSPGIKKGYYTFEFKPSAESREGDQYKLMLKLLSFSNSFTLTLATQYDDGSISLNSKKSTMTGWTDLTLQTDRSRHIRRIYGYIGYEMQNQNVAFIDSIQILRTHLNESSYSIINTQKFISKTKDDKVTPAQPEANEAVHPSVSASGPQQIKDVPEPAVPVSKNDRSQKLYIPKDDLNKSGHSNPQEKRRL